MTIKLDASGALAKIARLKAVQQQLPQIAQKVEAEAVGMLHVSAMVNIYSSAPGAYSRTGEYLSSLNAQSRATKRTATVTVSSSSEYAAYIEFGRGKVSAAMLQQMALGLPTNEPLYQGRSGQQWWISGPILISAQAFAFKRLKELFRAEVLRVNSRK